MRILCAVCQQKKIFTILGVGGLASRGPLDFIHSCQQVMMSLMLMLCLCPFVSELLCNVIFQFGIFEVFRAKIL